MWLLPAALFACAHTAIPVIQGDAAIDVLGGLISGLLGYAVMSCAFYGLRRWSGSLWLPVLVHAAFDFLVVFK